MRTKNGYKNDKPKLSTCNWLKRYFEKNTSRKFIVEYLPEYDYLKGNENKYEKN